MTWPDSKYRANTSYQVAAESNEPCLPRSAWDAVELVHSLMSLGYIGHAVSSPPIQIAGLGSIMGAFLVNFHVQSTSVRRVTSALKNVLDQGGWMAGPHDGWISFWDEEASRQNDEGIRQVAESVSRSLKAPLIAFLVHDGDIFCYWLYEAGNLLDEFNSCPSYWGDDEIDEVPLQADVAAFARICLPGTTPEMIQEILVQDTRAARAAGELSAFTFAEERLTKLAPLLRLREDIVLADFGSIGTDVSANEIGARWVGAGRPPVDSDEPPDEDAERKQFLKKAPLHAAAEQDDITTIKRLLASGRDVNEMPGGFQVTPLAMAAALGTPPTIRALVELGADIHNKGREGASPIRCAVQAGKIGNLRVLVELGADLSDYNSQMGTLLHLAVTMQSPPELIRTLLELGVDADRKNEAGLKPIDIVRRNIQSFERLRSLMQPLLAKKPDENQRMDDDHRKLTEVEQLLSGKPS